MSQFNNTMHDYGKRREFGALGRMALYALIILAPLIFVVAMHPVTDHGFVYTIGKNLGLVGFMILGMQFVLSARFKWIERPFGLNLLFDFHKTMAIVGSLLILSHPILLAIGGPHWNLIFGPSISWHIWLGRIALMVLLVHALLSLLRLVIKLNYQTWRFVHNCGALVVFPLVLFHSWNAGEDLALLPIKFLWLMVVAAGVGSFCWHRLVRPMLLKARPYSVIDVRQESPDTWTIKLAPPQGAPRFDFLPGQFHFLTFYRAPNLPVEEHHWTISSSPTEEGILDSTIKESGDFTVSIGKTRPGDEALVYGPFGRFSYTLHPEEVDLVFIAAGIGVTPLMSMLRHMRDTGDERRVLLLYGNTKEEDIIFKGELERIAAGGHPHLEIVHVLSDPPEQWQGEKGRLDVERIDRLCSKWKGRAFYICAPREAMDAAVKFLCERGVPADRVHFERFNL